MTIWIHIEILLVYIPCRRIHNFTQIRFQIHTHTRRCIYIYALCMYKINILSYSFTPDIQENIA